MRVYLVSCHQPENPVNPETSCSGHDAHEPDSRALYQNWVGRAIVFARQAGIDGLRASLF